MSSGLISMHDRAVDLANRSNFDPNAINWVTAFEMHIITKRLLCASLTLVLYDLALTADQSDEFFVERRWTISKILFFINRWDGPCVILLIVIETFITPPSERSCRAILWLQYIGVAILVMALCTIFTIRVYALWNRSRTILFLCLAAATINFVSYAVVVAYSTATEFVTVASAPFTGCTIHSSDAKVYLMFVASITFDTIIITLTVIKSYPLARVASRTSLFTMILEDGLIYYFSILALHLLNLIIIFTPSLAVGSLVAFYPAFAVVTVACNRLLIRQHRMLLGHESEMTSNFKSFGLLTVPIALRNICRHGSDPSFSSRDSRRRDGISRSERSLEWELTPRAFGSSTDLDGRGQQVYAERSLEVSQSGIYEE